VSTRITYSVLAFILLTGYSASCQDYREYFTNKAIADSLIKLGRYDKALEKLRLCVSVREMATITDEFYLGYAYFKAGKIDSASLLLNEALSEGFYFQKLEYVEYWQKMGVFDKFNRYKALQSIREELVKNTMDYFSGKPLDSPLAKDLISARELDQQYRGKNASHSTWKKQVALERANREFLDKIIKRYGWPGKKLVGYHGSNSAFLIAQHSDMDTVFQNECLRHIRLAFHKHDVNAADYAYIIDRHGFESPRVENKNRVSLEILRVKKRKIWESSNPNKTIVSA
jgi:tetratricopeptide (TPR) repeat protein